MFQNDVFLYFQSYWKRENVAGINFLGFSKLNDWASQRKKEWHVAADQVKGYGFKKWTKDCSWQWHVVDTPYLIKRKQKKNSGSVLTWENTIKSWDREMVVYIGKLPTNLEDLAGMLLQMLFILFFRISLF